MLTPTQTWVFFFGLLCFVTLALIVGQWLFDSDDGGFVTLNCSSCGGGEIMFSDGTFEALHRSDCEFVVGPM